MSLASSITYSISVAVLCGASLSAAERQPLAAPAPAIPVILDTDIGGYMDDAFALALILTSPELELRAVTTVHGDAYTRAQLVCNFLHALNRSKIPVAAGATPRPKPDYEGQMQYGLRPPYTRPVKPLAVDFLYEKLKAAPGDLTIICIGPLTNIAALLDKHPDSTRLIKRLIIMGGSLRVGYDGKPGPVAEWNVRQNVKAAQRVLSSGVPILLVPLDTTAKLQVGLTLQKELFAPRTLVASHLLSLLQLSGDESFVLHDAVAVAACCQQSLCTVEDLSLTIDERGITRASQAGTRCRIASSVRSAELERQFIGRIAEPLVNLSVISTPFSIRISATGSLSIQGEHVSIEQLRHFLRKPPKDLNKEKSEVRILAHRQTLYRHVIALVDELQSAGFHSIGFASPDPRVTRELVERGRLPYRIHAVENYETDIERRWWLSGKLETKNVPEGSRRACRAVLCRDFDDKQGDRYAIYKAVIFNPVPGPPMGKNTRLTFRYHLQGTDSIRVQLYTLSKGYHRQLTISDLPPGRWESATVDMTQARRPDGSGGPLTEDERIDDIQFYVDPAAELLIDDIVLYEAAAEDEKRPFPRHIHFTGWFDTGKQGAEWPGDFEIVAHKPPRTWKAARSVPEPDRKSPWIRIDLRGPRPISAKTRLRFRCHVKNSGRIIAELRLRNESRPVSSSVLVEGRDEWGEFDLDFAEQLEALSAKEKLKGLEVTDIIFRASEAGELLVDDVMLYEPGKIREGR